MCRLLLQWQRDRQILTLKGSLNGFCKVTNLGILCRSTAVTGIHRLTAFFQNDLVVGWIHSFLISALEVLLNCEGRWQYLLERFERLRFYSDIHQNIFDVCYLIFFQKWLALSACTYIAFMIECKAIFSEIIYNGKYNGVRLCCVFFKLACINLNFASNSEIFNTHLFN